ncbi:MAG TPA: hypothetical protein PKY22_01485 [Accumulibacter sp.]|nr:hypothetical protein [Accumulibacter sp.]
MEALNLKIRFSASATSHATTHFTIAGQKVIIAAGNTRRTVFSAGQLFITSIYKRHTAEASSRKTRRHSAADQKADDSLHRRKKAPTGGAVSCVAE